jgi:2-oxoacid:acceptor oxidoreductase gamma subunit (pyruvate/2-ketoisovalerate family)
MGKITEIRWHGRGGQGAKTAALLFGDAALAEGKYIQAFPEYGPERTGAPVQSFNTTVKQGMLEGSNVNISDEMVDMISVYRKYEASQKIVNMTDKTLELTVNLGRIGG